MAITLYGYKNCSTCKKAEKFLKAKSLDYKWIDITEKPPKKTELKKMLQAYEGNIKKLFNTSGQVYREQKISAKLPMMSESEAIDLLSKNGKLIKRPFLLQENLSLVGFKEEEWKKIR